MLKAVLITSANSLHRDLNLIDSWPFENSPCRYDTGILILVIVWEPGLSGLFFLNISLLSSFPYNLKAAAPFRTYL